MRVNVIATDQEGNMVGAVTLAGVYEEDFEDIHNGLWSAVEGASYFAELYDPAVLICFEDHDYDKEYTMTWSDEDLEKGSVKEFATVFASENCEFVGRIIKVCCRDKEPILFRINDIDEVPGDQLVERISDD